MNFIKNSNEYYYISVPGHAISIAAVIVVATTDMQSRKRTVASKSITKKLCVVDLETPFIDF